MSSEKSEEPTTKRLRDARRDGQVSRSTDFTDAVILLGMIACLMAAGPTMAGNLQDMVTVALRSLTGDRQMGSIIASMVEIGRLALLPICMPLLVAVFCSMAAQIPQVGLQVAIKPVIPNIEAVSPAAGIKRMFSVRTVVDLVKMLVKASIVAFVLYEMVLSLIPLVARSVGQPVGGAVMIYWGLVLKFLLSAGVVFLISGVVDIKLQNMMFMKKMRMSKDEVKREYKQDEGDPQIKGERRRLARQMAMGSGTGTPENEPAANALFVNPTHYSVAIRYDRLPGSLPIIVAKGADEAAAQLRREASANGVPIIGNPPVARALFKVEIGEPVPEELLETVAVILRWIDSLGQRTTTSVESVTS